eukprot:gene10570-biopygen4668
MAREAARYGIYDSWSPDGRGQRGGYVYCLRVDPACPVRHTSPPQVWNWWLRREGGVSGSAVAIVYLLQNDSRTPVGERGVLRPPPHSFAPNRIIIPAFMFLCPRACASFIPPKAERNVS